MRFLLILLLAGCKADPYCLTCEHALTTGDLSQTGGFDLAGADLAGGDLTGAPCTPTNNGVEICDGLDNDCNGVVDDVPASQLVSDPNNCGKCGTVCNFQSLHEFGSCTMSACVATGCMAGFVDIDGNPANGCEYPCTPSVPSTEVCDGRDNDCDGQIDNGLTPPANLCSDKGVCAGQTIPEVCTGAAGWKCDYSAVPNIELTMGRLSVIESKCDGLDGNCNGVVDLDGFPTVGRDCVAGQGVCQNAGHIVCQSSTSVGCDVVPSPGRATDELCNNLDDNCDGLIDEHDPQIVTMCSDGVGGMRPCKGYADPMVNIGGGVYVYEFEASRPDATGTSPGASSKRACSKSGALPWASVTQTQAEAACEAVLDSTKAKMRLCQSSEWQTACEGAAGAPPNGQTKWSITPSVSPAPSGVCNDERGSGAPWATGSGPTVAGKTCYAAWSGNDKIYDLSGNVVEWTSTTQTSGGTTYYEARGGSYTTPVDGTSCEYDFVIFPPGFVDTNLGFRCCADHAP
jgi:hypothetical protein